MAHPVFYLKFVLCPFQSGTQPPVQMAASAWCTTCIIHDFSLLCSDPSHSHRYTSQPHPCAIDRPECSFEDHLLLLLKEKRRVEATVFLRRLAHYDRNPPHLAASLLGGEGGGGKRARVACIPAWYQQISYSPAQSGGSSSSGSPGGSGAAGSSGYEEDDAGIEEVVDLTEKEAEVVECLDNEPVECVMTRVVKKEPGVEDASEAESGENAGADDDQGSSSSSALAGAAGADADSGGGPASDTGKVKMEVG